MLNPEVLSYFPYSFTKEQNQAIEDIRQDLSSGHIMQRLLQGEVGSGKTAAMFYVAIALAKQGKRTIIFAPTSILVEQHFGNLKNMGWDNVQLYISGCEDNDAAITIGTHAVIYDDKLLKSVSLICVDEFQRTGVEQRATLTKYNPHLLLVSATPLPRSLSMSVFGDLDVTVIKELPIKRGAVVTRWVLPEKREQMYEIIDRELTKGKQVYVVYPRIDGGEDVVSAERGFATLSERFNGDKIGLLTGRDPIVKKQQLMNLFNQGWAKILVSTIIAEVGLDNPNASVMVIEGADRFGLSQLHQLRGRICRSKDTTFCFMVSETSNEKSIARLDVMEKCNDGFEVAEYDLRLRGPGEMFSTRQHGLPDLKFASLLYDYDLLIKARDMAKEYIDKLDKPENVGLKQMLEIKYGDTIKLGGTA